MRSVFIFWHDWDGEYLEKFEDTIQGFKKAENKCLEILMNTRRNGEKIDAVIIGIKMKIEIVKKVSKVKLEREE